MAPAEENAVPNTDGKPSEQHQIHTVGSKVWVSVSSSEENEEHEWYPGEVVLVDGETINVRTNEGQEVQVAASEAPLQNATGQGGMEDMTKLSYLHEPGVLHNLDFRYSLDEIYTYTGNILIAVNPFQRLPHLYDSFMMEQYKGIPLGDLSPHVFAVADEAYRFMRAENKSQSILVSGESGAGKTETTKLIMQYLAFIGGRKTENSVEQQLLQSNPVLEAFGNAKTIRNDNSSRFGKFMEIQFNSDGHISGAAIRTYLLERSRVVQVNDPERNYHIFYQLADGASEDEKKSLFLGDASEYKYLNSSTCFTIDRMDNAEELQRTKEAMAIVGIGPDEQEWIFKTVAAILHLGNCEFEEEDEDTAKLSESSLPAASAFATLMEVPEEELHAALLTRKIVVVGETTTKPLSKQAALTNRDALAKKMYSLLFDWLVTRVNKSIGQDESCAHTIGVLDIYGFESFKKNSFEQFCINLANEKLQQHFNQHVFKMEQHEYIKEKIDWSYIDFVDNQDVLDLIEGKHTGVLTILDEQCKLGVDHFNFAEKLFQSFVRDKKKYDPTGRFAKPKVGRETFMIRHYAGSVTYSSELFLDKNKDFVVPEHQRLLGEISSSSFVQELFKPATPAENGGRKRQGFTFLSVGTTFKSQLQALMDTLSKTEPHYIRCIKPNSKNKPSIFEKANVLHQLRCGGVLEAIRISCAGYPTRKSFEEFLDRFLVLAPDLYGRNGTEKELAETLLSRFKEGGVEGFQLGLTKVFLRAGQLAILDKLRSECLYRAAVTIQRYARKRLQQKKYQALRQASIVIQAHVRANKARSQYKRLKENHASIIIQKNWRRHMCTSTFRKSMRAIALIQSAYRGHRARSMIMELMRLRSAIIIQSYVRMYKDRKVYLGYLEATLTLQGCFRCSRAKAKFKKVKAELNAKDALLDKNAKLAKEIAELQRSLNQEKQFREQLRREAEVLREEVEQKRSIDDDREKELLAIIEAEKEKRIMESERADKLQSQAKALENELQASSLMVQTEMKTLQQENQTLKSSNGDLRLNLQKLETIATENKAEVFNLHEKIEKLDSDNAELRSELKETKDALSLAEASAQSKEEKIILLQHEIIKQQGNGNNNTPIIKIPSVSDMNLKKPDVPPLSSAEKTPLMNRSNMSPPSSDRSTPSIVAYASKSPSPQSVSKLSVESTEKLNREMEKRTALQNAMIGALSTNLGFSNGRPMAACIIFKSLMYWRALENDSATALLDQIYRALVSQVEMDKKNNSQLTYWLSNVSSLLSLIQQTVKSSSNSEPKARRRTSILLGRWNQLKQTLSTPSTVSTKINEDNSYVDGSTNANAGGKKGGTYGQIDAKYSVIVFKMQITKLVEKIYTQLRDNLKEAITPLMGHCIQAPKHLKGSKTKGPSAGNQSQALVHWVNVVVIMNDLLESLKMNHCAPFMSQKLFDQLFQFMNTQLFNSILLKKDCCSFSNGEYVKTGLAELEHWIESVGKVWLGSALDELKYIRQAVSFLVVQKSKKSFDEIQNDLCPALNVQQLYRLATYYWDDKYGTETVSPEVLRAMKKQMLMGQNSGQSPSFLITDDDSRDLPFTLEDIAKEVVTVNLRELPVPEQLGPNSDFAFLHDT